MTTYNLAGPRFSSAAFSDPRGVPADFNEPHNAPHNAPYNAPLIGEAAQLGMNASLFLQYFCSRTSTTDSSDFPQDPDSDPDRGWGCAVGA
jgi:hypothetical protein